MVWSGICASGKTPLVFVEQGAKINQKVYRRDIIETVVLPCDQKHFGNANWMLQQDSAPICKAKKAQEWCKLRVLVAALWDKKLAFRTRERKKFWVFTDGPQHREEKDIFGEREAVLRLNSASEKKSVLLKDQTDL
ncbi:uncharacterized protein TNCV_1108551 [Trichonephila clavipes]|nr:uncharacterized protein TNCV_1108551 [Trichonephila clavipes]